MWFALIWNGVASLICVIIAAWAFRDEDEGFGIFMSLSAALFFILFTATAFAWASDRDNERAMDKAKVKVTKTCYPYAVTNKVTKDDKITFACANDGKLRVVKVNP